MGKPDLSEKTRKYERMLSSALESIVVVEETNEAREFLEMAESYYNDGKHFLDEGDEVNALAAFSYGHAWLDAGMRLGVFDSEER
ncbi:MAG: DUF357 domain-containing protein, partial [Halobacteria archaeon]|nr:DUF357 domain-containing protein [Halobacteria archaeon]